jgi:hypothetical protein
MEQHGERDANYHHPSVDPNPSADRAGATVTLNHQLEHTSRQRYSSSANTCCPEFGAMRMGDIAPVHVREWITWLKDQRVSASTIAGLKTILSAIFTTALNDQIAAVPRGEDPDGGT